MDKINASGGRIKRTARFYRKVGGLHFFRLGRFTFMACKGRRV